MVYSDISIFGPLSTPIAFERFLIDHKVSDRKLRRIAREFVPKISRNERCLSSQLRVKQTFFVGGKPTTMEMLSI
jgi:hypothetical protein